MAKAHRRFESYLTSQFLKVASWLLLSCSIDRTSYLFFKP
ncbi:hypothetical protein FOPPYZMZ_CDS0063 [Pseudomonas phage 9Ps-7B]|nr:hypothetical protein IPCDMZAV_CDS0386 [Pseudomonas phage 6B]WRQ05995.1 hypothetical protein QAMIJHJT_CDS0064 [Pseudomonas phage 9-Ps-8B]WRQ06403.1 hypothetical protein FOPPYZMZ_CDS0063 [Pseudomonas phage 9Ps-7B]WRQ06754.1 hypothetical protein ZBUARNPM_CDS0005 [Pseudomonas phage 14Ps5-6]